MRNKSFLTLSEEAIFNKAEAVLEQDTIMNLEEVQAGHHPVLHHLPHHHHVQVQAHQAPVQALVQLPDGGC